MNVLRSVFSRLRDFVVTVGGFFDQTQVARYITIPESATGITIPDPNAQLPVSDRHIRDIHAPGLLKGSLPIIMFRTIPTGTPSFSVRLNSTRLSQQTLSESHPMTWHEIIPTGALRQENNELTLAVSGEGTVRFTDIVIFYTSDKLTTRVPLPEPVFDPGDAT